MQSERKEGDLRILIEGHQSHIVNIRAGNKPEHFVKGEYFRNAHAQHS